ncbi:zonadhesin-like [Amphiura filiformis]|uniref:zonadhesin-like n=1 Tax=Amphiura filiformis TaxID=82378 RepID=UPI003B21D930
MDEHNSIAHPNLDFCMNSTCVNGDCINGRDGFTCACYEGWRGPNCDIDVCNPNHCENGATCVVEGNSFSCICAEGYFGSNCSIAGPCVPVSPCGSGGECLTIDEENHVCRCLANATGESCETEQGICHASGDPHYISFDGTYFDYMGGCQYVFSQECVEDPIYRVIQKNTKPVEKPSVAYTTELYIFVFGMRIDFLQEQEFTIDDEIALAPATPLPGLEILQEDGLLVLRTNFSLEVRWDGDNTVDVLIDSSFMDRTCGLCGNYNGDDTDDFLNPNNTLEETEEDFGNSWHYPLPEDGMCLSNESAGLDPCDGFENRTLAEEYCSIITNTAGPFGSCASTQAAELYYQSCLYDACAMQDDAHCNIIANFASYCGGYGYDVEPWRSDIFCPFECPANSMYSLCANPCQATCMSPSVDYSICPGFCSEGCECVNGTVSQGGQCIPEDQCGCMYDGRYYADGSTFTTSGCSERCTCSNGNTMCESITCSRYGFCGLQEGVYGCHCNQYYTGDGVECTSIYGRCFSMGHPRFRTYDAKTYDLVGECEYLFTAADCLADNRTFEIITRNTESHINSNYTYTDSVLIILQDYEIILGPGYKVFVDEARVSLPVRLGDLKIRRSGRQIKVKTGFGLTVFWNGRHFIKSRLHMDYMGETCGLCGNFNSDPNDDFITPEGNLASATNFINSWVYNAECIEMAEVPAACDNQTLLDSATQDCSILVNTTGPFAECILLMPERGLYYFDFCRSEACLDYPNSDALCNVIENFLTECNDAEVAVDPWRSQSFCGLSCPANSTYSTCGSACPASCGDFRNGNLSLSCPEDACLEGCFCDPGFYLDGGGDCVESSACGCVYEGFYYEVDDSWVPVGCGERCTCTEGGMVECEVLACHEDAVCEVRNDTRDCYCREGFEALSGNGELCLVPCRSGQSRCAQPSNKCINSDYFCDAFPDDCAIDNADVVCETNPELCINNNYDESEELCCDIREISDYCYKPGYFRCYEGIYILEDWLCDGFQYDCLDNYDESEELCTGNRTM